MNYKLFTSESVCAGHPDKICDRISDAILDEALRQDPYSKTAIEAVVKDRVILVGEIKSTAKIDFEGIVRREIKQLGYTDKGWGFDHEAPIDIYVNEQSPEIAIGVGNDEGAGDQGMMFGFACNDTKELMPLPIILAHQITRLIDRLRETNEVSWLRPDGKAQVTVVYKNNQPVGVDKVVVAVAHDEAVKQSEIEQKIYTEIQTKILEPIGFSINKNQLIVNGTGLWHIPGPASDAGLTGRKIIVDSYGGFARVGGGAFSGKDPSKVDRSGAYAARFIAKNIVAKGLADRCEVALAYCIGKPNPVMQAIETFGTATVSINDIEDYSHDLIDTSVKGIVSKLDLRRPIYTETSAYGHFGKAKLPWEKIIL